jgi:hypothetical protein
MIYGSTTGISVLEEGVGACVKNCNTVTITEQTNKVKLMLFIVSSLLFKNNLLEMPSLTG